MRLSVEFSAILPATLHYTRVILPEGPNCWETSRRQEPPYKTTSPEKSGLFSSPPENLFLPLPKKTWSCGRNRAGKLPFFGKTGIPNPIFSAGISFPVRHKRASGIKISRFFAMAPPGAHFLGEPTLLFPKSCAFSRRPPAGWEAASGSPGAREHVVSQDSSTQVFRGVQLERWTWRIPHLLSR